MSDAKEYLYEYDPNFDFDNRDVNITRSDSMQRIKSNKIKKYYEGVEQGDKKITKDTLNETVKTPRARQLEIGSIFEQMYSDKKLSANYVPRRKNSDFRLTIVKKDIIAPGKMRSRAPYKLKEVCNENGYEISIQDFEDKRQLIGRGTFGEVYIVKCKLNNSKYALKILNKEFVKSSGYERHIMREKDILNALDHPNIVRLEHYFHDSDNCYFLFELCEVGDLDTFITEHKRLSSRLTREYTMELILALENLHKKNVVHRDLKPQNILLDDTFHIKLADFGAAKMINPEEVTKEINSKSFSIDSEDDDSSDDSEIDESSEEEETAKVVML